MVIAWHRTEYVSQTESLSLPYERGETFILNSDSVYQDGRLSYHGKDPKKDCGIRIGNVTESDNGNWT